MGARPPRYVRRWRDSEPRARERRSPEAPAARCERRAARKTGWWRHVTSTLVSSLCGGARSLTLRTAMKRLTLRARFTSVASVAITLAVASVAVGCSRNNIEAVNLANEGD